MPLLKTPSTLIVVADTEDEERFLSESQALQRQRSNKLATTSAVGEKEVGDSNAQLNLNSDTFVNRLVGSANWHTVMINDNCFKCFA